MKVENDPLVKEYYKDRQLADATREIYTYHLQNYSNFIGLSPSEFIEEADEQEEEGIRPRHRKINKYLKEHRKHLESIEYSFRSIRIALSVIRSFYREYEIELPTRRQPNTRKSKQILTSNDIPCQEDILLALDFANVKYQAIILLMASSGMGRSEIISLTFKDFIESLKKYYQPHENEIDLSLLRQRLDRVKTPVATWKVERIKTGMSYVTFSSPESIYKILDYLERSKTHSGQLSEPLFQGNRGGTLKKGTFAKYFQKINEKAGFTKNGSLNFFRSHNLRKYFATNLRLSGMDQISCDWLLGHDIKDRVRSAYFLEDPTALKLEYMQHLDKISITEKINVRVVTNEDHEKALRRIEELEKYKEEMNKKEVNMNRELTLIKKLLSDKEYNRDRLAEND